MITPPITFQMSNERKALPIPDGKPLIVHIVFNVENWEFDKDMPRKIITLAKNVERIPDVPNFSWAEYGMRCGLPRILQFMNERGLPASVNINAAVIDAYPSCADAMLKAGWEFIGHGYNQRAIQPGDDEAAIISRSTEKLKAYTGIQPRGWLGPGLHETFQTADLLKKYGYDYVCDWVLDDLPCWIPTKHGNLIVMPYNLEINDAVVYSVEKHSSPEIYNRLVDTLDTFEDELQSQPRVLTLALHPYLMGVPHRFVYLKKMLTLLESRDDVVFMTGSQIADWFMSVSPPDDRSR